MQEFRERRASEEKAQRERASVEKEAEKKVEAWKQKCGGFRGMVVNVHGVLPASVPWNFDDNDDSYDFLHQFWKRARLTLHPDRFSLLKPSPIHAEIAPLALIALTEAHAKYMRRRNSRASQ